MSIASPLVKDFMTPNPVVIHPADSVEAAVKLMEEHRISGLPVTDEEGKVVGILSEGDLLVRESPLKPPLYVTFLGSIIYFESPVHFHQHMKKALGMFVQDAMTANPITIHPDALLSAAAELMLNKRVNRLPVVDENRQLLGIITRHDLLFALQPQAAV